MQHFTDLKVAVSNQFEKLKEQRLFTSKASRDELWDTYLSSFPEGTNPMFRERTEHDCNCCKQFIRTLGNVVAVVDGQLTSLWDVNIGGHYQVVADAMHKLVVSTEIDNIFLHDQRDVGTDYNHENGENGVIRWEHFHQTLPSSVIKNEEDIATIKGLAKTNFKTFTRSVTELSHEAVDIVLDLINQGSLYRGKEHKKTVTMLRRSIKEYESATFKDIYAWEQSLKLRGASNIRNSAIGSLVTDISDGVDLEKAVNAFDSKVAPHNYKRTSAVVTQTMIKKAQEKVEALGLESALQRRFATVNDITINNVLFADRTAKQSMGIFDEIQATAPEKLPNLDKVEEIEVEKFLSDVLPKATSLEVLVENKHTPNFASLIAPTDDEAKNILKWNNNFSWSYSGEVTDSIKERVKAAGGNVTGDLRCSLSWFNSDDLDIHLKQPNGRTIHFGAKHDPITGGRLDVDMNISGRDSDHPVENITFPKKGKMEEGIYLLRVNNYTKRESHDVGFEVEVEFDGHVTSFAYEKTVRSNMYVNVAKFRYTKKGGIEFLESIPSSSTSREEWGISTQKFQKVEMVMLSPNHWDEQEKGNKHYFFMLDGCKNPDAARGFYNEFLRDELHEHRKVFEVLGSKLKAEPTEQQLSGLGFSSTKRNHLLCRVSGTFNRVLKVKF